MVDRHFLPDFIFGENFYASDILRVLQLLPIVFETSLSVSSVPFEGDEAYESEARKVADEIGTGAIRLLAYTSTSNLAYLRVVAAIAEFAQLALDKVSPLHYRVGITPNLT